MAQRYEIGDVSTIDGRKDSAPRNVTLRAGGRSISHISKCTERLTDFRTVRSSGDGKVLNECYLEMSLPKLRELGGNRFADDMFVLNRARFLDSDLVNVIVVKLHLWGDDRLEDKDYDCLNSLLSWDLNSIYVMPMLEFHGRERKDMVSTYESFVKEMLERKSSWIGGINIGMSIPRIYPRRSTDSLFDLYSDEKPTFVAVDFNNSCMDRPSDCTGAIMEHFRQEKEENVFLYGINVRPYKGGGDGASAWDVYMAHGSFNAIGPAHPKSGMMPLPDDWSDLGRIFDPGSVEYRTIDAEQRDTFIGWMEDSYGMDVDPVLLKNGRSMYPYLKRYNFQQANDLLYEFSKAVRDNDTDFIARMADAMPEEMKGVSVLDAPRKKARRSESRGRKAGLFAFRPETGSEPPSPA